MEAGVILKGRLLEVTPEIIRYMPEGKGYIQTINRNRVVKLVYSDGTQVILKEKQKDRPGKPVPGIKKKREY